jgi:putative phosphoesterase
MHLAVFSDTHDNLSAVRKALEIARRRSATEILHCGDLTSAPTVELFRGWTLQYVFGNMDRNETEIRAAIGRLGAGSSCGLELHLEREGLRIALLHGNRTEALAAAARSGKYDLVFHGHTHRRRDERVGRTRLVNPGALGSVAADGHSFCLLDTVAAEVEFIAL